MIHAEGYDRYPPFLNALNDKPVLFPLEFFPLEEEHQRCRWDTVLFWDYADDLMASDYFRDQYRGFFAVYVVKACSKCGEIEWEDKENGIPRFYLKLVRETTENRSRFHYHNDSDYDSSDYEWM